MRAFFLLFMLIAAAAIADSFVSYKTPDGEVIITEVENKELKKYLDEDFLYFGDENIEKDAASLLLNGTIKILKIEDFQKLDVEVDKKPDSFIEFNFEDECGYLKIIELNSITTDEIQRLYDVPDVYNKQCLVVDLRGNTGGLLVSIGDITERYVEDTKTILKVKSKKNVMEIKTSGEKQSNHSSLYVVVDETTQSGAAVLAYSLQKYASAKVIGMPTDIFGGVDTVLILKGGTAVKMPTSFFQDDDNIMISDSVVKPDILLNDDGSFDYGTNVDLPDNIQRVIQNFWIQTNNSSK